MFKPIIYPAAILLVGALSQTSLAGPVEGLTSFTAGTPARAGEVNGNFATVRTAVNDNDTRLNALLAQMAELQTQVSIQQTQLSALQTQLTNVIPLNNVVSVTETAGVTTVRFSNVNVQIINGQRDTATANGAGNLIIGYNRARIDDGMHCSQGYNPALEETVDSSSECAAVNGIWARNHKSGSHNLVIGDGHNYSRWGGLIAGFSNTVNYNYGSVTGGTLNMARGEMASVSGGELNAASGARSTVGGGWANTSPGLLTSITGGAVNVTAAAYSSISGGIAGAVSGEGGSISGGENNEAAGQFSSVSGGRNNIARGNSSSVSGGVNRTQATSDGDWAAGSLFQDN